MNTQTGNSISFVSLIILILAHFGIIVEEQAVITVIAGIGALYGIIHQYIITRKVVAMAKANGVQGLR